MLDQRNALRRNAFVIELVVAQQILPAEFFHCGVIGDAQEFRKNLLANLF